MLSSSRHPDFEKIHAAFLQHYSQNPQLGEDRYAEWVKISNLDETQSYYLQGAQRATGIKQNFDWAKFLLQFVKEDKDALYYKVEALFPVESMNKDSPPFTRDEVLQAARSLTGKPSDLNHDTSKILEGVEIVAAQFENDCVECLVRILKTSPLVGMIKRKEIVNVSIEGEWSHGISGQGLVLTGLGWLTQETTLPGIPLTRIMPVDKIAESFKPGAPHVAERKMVKVGSCVGCGGKADYLVSACKECYGKFTASVAKMFLSPVTSDSLACVFCGHPGEYVVTTCGSCGDNAQSKVAEESVAQQLEPQMPGEYLLGFYQDSILFLAEHFRVVWLDQANGILAVMAKTRADPSLERCQSILFLASKWQPNTVADWLGSHPDYQVSAGSSVQINGVEKLEEKDIDIFAEKVAAKIGGKDSAITEKLKTELAESKKLQGEAENKAKLAEELRVKAVCDLAAANTLIEGFKKLAPGMDLLASPPTLMPVSEHIAVLEGLIPPVMVERSSMGMHLQGQAVRAALLKAKEKLKAK